MIKLLRCLSKKELLLAFFCLILTIGQVWLELRMPEYLAEITKLVQTEGSKMPDILAQGGFMLLCAAGSMVISIIIGYFAANISAAFTKITQLKVFKKVSSFSMGEIKAFSVSSLITRTTNDITQVRTFIAIGLQMLIRSPILAIWAVKKIWDVNTDWTIFIGIILLFLLIVAAILIKIVLPKFKIVQQLTDNLNRVTRENLIGVRVIRAFNAEKYQQNKFASANGELRNVQIFTGRTMAVMWPILALVMQGLTLGIYFIGSNLINKAKFTERLDLFSDMLVFSSYGMLIIMSFIMLVMVFIIYPRASVSAKRILEVLETDAQIIEGDIIETQEKGTIEFKNVSFKYPDAKEAEGYALQDISFKVKKGETLAIIGSTGCGKTSLINLIPRFYDATEGEVLVNGINVKEYKQASLNNLIGYISQKAVIFNGSVNDNIAYGEKDGKKPDNKEIINAIEIAQGREIIDNMPEKYETILSQGGTNISGGQKQRIAIARAICRNPEIYIFDDSFSALDYKTDYLLRKKLNKETKAASKIIVAQRIGTIKEADQIIVLDEGKIVGIGTHQSLLDKCKVYQEIALSQLSKEELENGR